MVKQSRDGWRNKTTSRACARMRKRLMNRQAWNPQEEWRKRKAAQAARLAREQADKPDNAGDV